MKEKAHRSVLGEVMLVAVAAVVLAILVPHAADASRTSVRLDAGLNRPAAPAQGGTGGTGGVNGGSSGGSSSTNNNSQDPNVNEAAAQAMLDELIASDPQPQDFPVDNLGSDAQGEVENLDEEPADVSFITLFHSILSRFRN